jgi:hypothetical protein
VIASRRCRRSTTPRVLLPLVNRDYDATSRASRATRSPSARRRRSRSTSSTVRTGIVLQDPTEGSFTVTLDKLLDVSFPITSEELTLELDRFEERLLNPAMEAIAGRRRRLAEALVDAAESVGGGGTVHRHRHVGRRPASRRSARRAASWAGTSCRSPSGTRCSPRRASRPITGRQPVLQANTSGSTEALREGAGRPDQSGSTPTSRRCSATARTTRARPTASRSTAPRWRRSPGRSRSRWASPAQVSVQNYKGLGLRVVKDYDVDKKQDVISVDLLFGTDDPQAGGRRARLRSGLLGHLTAGPSFEGGPA